MRSRRIVLPLLLGLASLGACSSPQQTPADMTTPDGIAINKTPTGSIQTPSLCERTTLDQRITTHGADGFAFVWVDTHYQVVYQDHATGDIYALQLSAEGTPLGAAVVVESTPSTSSLPAILRTSSGFLVAWQEEEIHALHVHALDLEGLPTGAGKQLATTRSSQLRPVLAQSPAGVAVSWMDQDPGSVSNLSDIGTGTTYMAVLDDTYSIRTDVPVQQLAPGDQSGYPWLGGTGSDLGLLYSHTVAGQTDVYFSTVASPLTLSAPVDIRGTGGVNAALLGRLSRTDFGYLATWEDHRIGDPEIFMSLLDPSGARFAGGLVEEPDTGSANWPHQAWTGTSAAIVYYQYRAGRPQIFMTFVDQTGARLGGAADAQISNTTAQARFPDVQWDGSQFGVLWIDSRNTPTELYFNSSSCKKPAPL